MLTQILRLVAELITVITITGMLGYIIGLLLQGILSYALESQEEDINQDSHSN